MTGKRSFPAAGIPIETTLGLVNGAVACQYCENAAFLWRQRDQRVHSPSFKLIDLERWDERIEANLEGALQVAHQDASYLEMPAPKQPEAVFVAAVVALQMGARETIELLISLAASGPPLSRGLVSAFEWLPFEQAVSTLQWLLASEAPATFLLGLRGFVAHRVDPGVRALDRALISCDRSLRLDGLRACAELGARSEMPLISRLLTDPDPAVRFHAAWSATRLGERRAAVDVLCQFAEDGEPSGAEAGALAVRALPVEQARLFCTRLLERGDSRTALRAMGALGLPEQIPIFLAAMAEERTSRIAGEAFSSVTGLDLAFEDLDREAPSPGDEEAQENLEPASREDADLPWPDPDALASWWRANEKRFAKGTRHLFGAPVGPESLRRALREGSQRQRAAAALEEGLLEPGRPLFNVAAKASYQNGELATAYARSLGVSKKPRR